jgi:predicted transcriptional regulator
MAEDVKFASQLDAEVLQQLRAYASVSGRTISSVLRDAVSEYLARARVRPAFHQALEATMDEHDELLARLAR